MVTKLRHTGNYVVNVKEHTHISPPGWGLNFSGHLTGYYRYEIQMLEIQIRALVSCCAVARAQLLGQKSRFAQQPQRGWLRAAQHEFFMRAKFFAAGEKKMKHLFF